MTNEIVVGLSDSPESRVALEWAAEHAIRTGTVLRAVHVLDWPYGISPPSFPRSASIDAGRAQEREDAHRSRITAMFDAIHPRPGWLIQFAVGHSGQVLVRQEASLLVVGTREHVGLGRLINGSVSHYCLSHSACPVVAVPMSASDTAEAATGSEGPALSTSEAVEIEPTIEPTGEAAMVAPTRELVVAGIEASGESLAGARFAVAAADLRGADLMMVHAFAAPPAVAGMMVAALTTSRAAAEKRIEEIVTQLAVPAGVRVSTFVAPGDPTTVLRVTSRRASLVVLGQDHVSWTQRVSFGAVASRIARTTTCPVAIVPDSWRARSIGKPQPVVLAVDGETRAVPALTLAFREARIRRSELVVLHAEPLGASRRDRAAAELELGVLLSGWKQRHPEVPVTTTMVSGDPDANLARWSRSASVLVVGRPHAHGWGSWTRSVAHRVMQQTRCPLLIAAPGEIQQGSGGGPRSGSGLTVGHGRTDDNRAG
jgi:nucleotide-binding universal stress UspA family protein